MRILPLSATEAGGVPLLEVAGLFIVSLLSRLRDASLSRRERGRTSGWGGRSTPAATLRPSTEEYLLTDATDVKEHFLLSE
jgi:hypothetical protein